jgi:hypothetical protein
MKNEDKKLKVAEGKSKIKYEEMKKRVAYTMMISSIVTTIFGSIYLFNKKEANRDDIDTSL